MQREKKICIIEDNEDWIEFLEESIVKNLDAEVNVFKDKETAEGFLRREKCDLIIADIVLDPENINSEEGMMFAEFAENRKIPIILITGYKNKYTADMIKEAFRKYNVLDYFFKKEFDEKEFIDSVKSALLEQDIKTAQKIDIKMEDDKLALEIDGMGHIFKVESATGKSRKSTKFEQFENAGISKRLLATFKSYPDATIKELKDISNYLLKTEFQKNIVFSQLSRLLKRLTGTDNLILDFFDVIDKKKVSEDLKIFLSLCLVPKVLNLEPGQDLEGYKKSIYGKVPMKMYDTYTDIAEIYFSLKGKSE